MFKQVKSALIWFYLFKFRKKISLILALLLLVVFAQSIYADVVSYLQISGKIDLLIYVLIAKWALILASLFSAIRIFLSFFKKSQLSAQDEVPVPLKQEAQVVSEKEQWLKNKAHLRSRAEKLIAEKSAQKAKEKRQ